MKRLEREGNHSLLSSAESKNDGAITQLRHMPLWLDVYLIKHMEKSPFYHTVMATAQFDLYQSIFNWNK
jgi:hypothetical protein